MPRIAISIGPVFTMVVGEIYALPARRCLAYIGLGAGAAIEVSNDGTTFTAVTLDANKNAELAAAFIRTTVTDSTIRLVVA